MHTIQGKEKERGLLGDFIQTFQIDLVALNWSNALKVAFKLQVQR